MDPELDAWFTQSLVHESECGALPFPVHFLQKGPYNAAMIDIAEHHLPGVGSAFQQEGAGGAVGEVSVGQPYRRRIDGIAGAIILVDRGVRDEAAIVVPGGAISVEASLLGGFGSGGGNMVQRVG